MKGRRFFTVLALLYSLTACVPTIARDIQSADNLQKDGAQADADKKPVVLFFTLPDCSYCRIVRYDYLLPILRNRAGTEKPVIREVEVTGQRQLTNFDGQRMTEAELARKYQVQMTPTVMFVNASGEALAESILGGDHAQYLALFDRSLKDAEKIMVGKRVKVR